MVTKDNIVLCDLCFSQISEKTHSCTNCDSIQNHKKWQMSLPEGTVVADKYIIGKVLYNDGSYFCYCGYDRENEKKVLIKELFPGGGYCRREGKNLVLGSSDEFVKAFYRDMLNDFHKEVKRMSEFKTEEGISRVRRGFDENGTSYCVFSFPQSGMLLSEYLEKNGGHLTMPEALRITEGVIRALDVIHTKGYVHGNIRPENIIIYGKKVALTGFNCGMCKYIVNPSEVLCTDANVYAPVEMFKKSGCTKPCDDIYALGTTLYHMLTGKFLPDAGTRLGTSGNPAETIKFDYADAATVKLRTIIAKMTAPKSEGRHKNLDSLCADLKQAKLLNIKLKRDNKAELNKKAKGGKKLWIIAAIAVLLLAGLITFFALHSCSDNGDEDEKTEKKPREEVVVAEEISFSLSELTLF